MRASRLFVAAFLIPVAAVLADNIARRWDGNIGVIDANGSAVGVLVMVASVFAVSRVAADDRWPERAGTSIAMASAFFLLTWVRYGDPSLSVDAQPHLVWFGFCVAAFAPAVVLMPASKWAWSAYREHIASPAPQQ